MNGYAAALLRQRAIFERVCDEFVQSQMSANVRLLERIARPAALGG